MTKCHLEIRNWKNRVFSGTHQRKLSSPADNVYTTSLVMIYFILWMHDNNAYLLAVVSSSRAQFALNWSTYNTLWLGDMIICFDALTLLKIQTNQMSETTVKAHRSIGFGCVALRNKLLTLN